MISIKNLREGQQMAKVPSTKQHRNTAENVSWMSKAHERYKRQTGGFVTLLPKRNKKQRPLNCGDTRHESERRIKLV